MTGARSGTRPHQPPTLPRMSVAWLMSWISKETSPPLQPGNGLLVRLDDEDEIAEVKRMIERHEEYTGSTRATTVLSSWADFLLNSTKCCQRITPACSALSTESAKPA